MGEGCYWFDMMISSDAETLMLEGGRRWGGGVYWFHFMNSFGPETLMLEWVVWGGGGKVRGGILWI